MKRLTYPLIFIFVVLIFFWKFFLQGLLPIPADTIVGLYYPFRDLYQETNPAGIPFKNFLITDPVRQQYPWRNLSISLLKQGELPFWNPYTHAGTPFLANFQSAVFYPFNIIFFLTSFNLAWSILIILQPLLAGLFLYFYLCHFKLRKEACFLGALTYSFSGFFIAWLEWNTILHVALWLPLALLSMEKTIECFSKPVMRKIQILFWEFIFVFSLISSFFAGHLQIFFYFVILIMLYLILRLLVRLRTILLDRNIVKGMLIVLGVGIAIILLITSIQWLHTIKLINLSARSLDQMSLPAQAGWQRAGWFIPWRHFIQFFAPDFFGNPATLNYWGVWNYGEMIGYVGILSLIMALFAMIYRQDKKTLFFGSVFFLSLIFAAPTWFAKLPYRLQIPLLSTSQPTRLLFLTDFSLSVLSALGLDYFLKRKSSIVRTIRLLILIGAVYAILWGFVFVGGHWLLTNEWIINLAVVKRNLILPTVLFTILAALLIFIDYFCDKEKFQKFRSFAIYALLFFAVFDLFRFGWKFMPFTKQEYLFPSTSITEFLQKQPGIFRIMSTDKRILPPNFSIIYRLQTVDGYDPLYLKSYGELAGAWVRNKPDISPFSFNRILTPENYGNNLANLLNIKYVLSLEELKSAKLIKVFEKGKTKIYENKEVYPRAFLVESAIKVNNKQEAIEKIFDKNVFLRKQAIVYNKINISSLPLRADEYVKIIKYTENTVKLEANTLNKRLLVLSDSYYPNWQVFIDGNKGKIYKVDYNLRGVLIPKGRHSIIFNYRLL